MGNSLGVYECFHPTNSQKLEVEQSWLVISKRVDALETDYGTKNKPYLFFGLFIQ